MCNTTGIAFGETVLDRDAVAGRDVLDVGALDVNGSLRPFVESLGPARYVGVDIASGPGVDVVLDASRLVEYFGANSFDIVISTEMVEHIRDWRTVVSNMKGVLRPGGLLLVTTRSIGFPYHAYPYDFWRYEPEDMSSIFADLDMVTLERDTDAPGVFLLARKPATFTEVRSPVALYSIISGRRRADISTIDIYRFRAGRRIRTELPTVTRRLGRRARQARKLFRRYMLLPAWHLVPLRVKSGLRRALGRA